MGTVGYAAFALVCVAALSSSPTAKAATFVKPLEPFTGLQSSLPFNVEIGLTSSPHPYLVMETTAAQSIDELIDFESKGEGVLRLHWLKDLESEEAAATKASLRVPPGTLKSLVTIDRGYICMHGPAAVSSVFETFSTGLGLIIIVDAPFQTIRATTEGQSVVSVNGTSIQRIEFENDGTGSGWFSGVSGKVVTNIHGTTNLIIDGNDQINITGIAAPGSEIHFSDGVCSVSTTNPDETPCLPMEKGDLPHLKCALSRDGGTYEDALSRANSVNENKTQTQIDQLEGGTSEDADADLPMVLGT